MKRIVIAVALVSSFACIAGATEPVRPADIAALRKLYRDFTTAPDSTSDAYLRQFWRESGAVARARGPQILYAVLHEARRDHDEAIIAYLPLIFQLERRETLRILHAFARSHPEGRAFIDYILAEIRQHEES